ncbi:unnamed protein product, partial [Prorocentrum cordatum]
ELVPAEVDAAGERKKVEAVVHEPKIETQAFADMVDADAHVELVGAEPACAPPAREWAESWLNSADPRAGGGDPRLGEETEGELSQRPWAKRRLPALEALLVGGPSLLLADLGHGGRMIGLDSRGVTLAAEAVIAKTQRPKGKKTRNEKSGRSSVQGSFKGSGVAADRKAEDIEEMMEDKTHEAQDECEAQRIFVVFGVRLPMQESLREEG